MNRPGSGLAHKPRTGSALSAASCTPQRTADWSRRVAGNPAMAVNGSSGSHGSNGSHGSHGSTAVGMHAPPPQPTLLPPPASERLRNELHHRMNTPSAAAAPAARRHSQGSNGNLHY